MTAAGFGVAMDWLPPSVIARQEREARAEERQAKAEAAEREAAAEAAHDRAIAAYMGAAIARGEDVGAADVMAGNIGRTLADVLEGAAGELADRIPVGQRPERDYELILDGVVVQRSRRGELGTGYLERRQLEQATELHRDFIAVRARHDYPAALERTRAQSTGAAQRANYPEDGSYGEYPEIRR